MRLLRARLPQVDDRQKDSGEGTVVSAPLRHEAQILHPFLLAAFDAIDMNEPPDKERQATQDVLRRP